MPTILHICMRNKTSSEELTKPFYILFRGNYTSATVLCPTMFHLL